MEMNIIEEKGRFTIKEISDFENYYDINLSLVLKIIKNGIYFTHRSFKTKKIDIKFSKRISFNFEDKTFMANYQSGCRILAYDDYGSDFSLNKKDVEKYLKSKKEANNL